jgi:hypothetical protein
MRFASIIQWETFTVNGTMFLVLCSYPDRAAVDSFKGA